MRQARPAGIAVRRAGSDAFLDQVFEIELDLTDAQDEFRERLRLIPLQSSERVRCVYRGYMSDDLTDIAEGPAILRVEATTFRRGRAIVSAVSPRLNVNRTGILYAPRDIPMLRGFK